MTRPVPKPNILPRRLFVFRSGRLARARLITTAALAVVAISMAFTRNITPSEASSHREAPLIVADPLADNTDTYALFKSGQVAEARRSIDEALRLGTRDARISYHAGMIYSALGLKERGARYFEIARAIDPGFEVHVALNKLLLQ